jgi:hypothetical protein
MKILQTENVTLANRNLDFLLRFLAHNQPNSSTTKKLLTRLYRDENLELKFPSCCALTEILMSNLKELARNSTNDFGSFLEHSIKLTSPIYSSSNYLVLQPQGIAKVRGT